MHKNKNSGWCHVHKSYPGRQLFFTDLPFPMSAIVSAAYIKVYLLENGICVAKKKTKSVRKSLDPLYNQVLVFSESPQGKVVQVRNTVELLLDRLDFWTWDEMSPKCYQVAPEREINVFTKFHGDRSIIWLVSSRNLWEMTLFPSVQ